MISMIVAVDNRLTIGNNNDLPWSRIPADMKHFKETTLGKPIVMGRKTFDSIGKPLPGRENIIITRDTNFSPSDVTVKHSVQEVLNIDNINKEIFIIGGATIYKEFLPHANKLYITRIDGMFEGNTTFPEPLWNEWRLMEQTHRPKDEKNPYDLTFEIWQRV
jgi:dihydrofolate reductase